MMSPQMSLYIDTVLYMEVKARAKEQGVPSSKIVSDALKEMFDDSWPEGYFEKYAGALKDRIFEIPEDLPWEPDEGETF